MIENNPLDWTVMFPKFDGKYISLRFLKEASWSGVLVRLATYDHNISVYIINIWSEKLIG